MGRDVEMSKDKLNHLKYKSLLLKIVHKYLPDAKVYLYGFRARGENAPEADIDLVLDNGEKIDKLKMFYIKDDIGEFTVPMFVDVVALNNINEEFKDRILKDRVLWTDGNI